MSSDVAVHERLFVGGSWVDPGGNGSIPVVDPTSEQIIATVPEAVPADVDRAVDAARSALPAWSATPAEERGACLARIAEGIDRRRSAIAVVIARELGMPLGQSDAIQVGMAITSFTSMAAAAELLPADERVGHSVVTYEPTGVVGAITPWNFPLQQIAVKVAAALAAGCTVVLKPSEVTPLNAFLLAEIAEGAGLVPGAFNLVTGTGPVVGEAIASHPDVDMVSFTGSTRAGTRVAQLGAASVKRIALELGGKSANIVLDDAHLEQAVHHGVASAFANSGQACSAQSRLLVPRPLVKQVEELAVAAAESYTTGDPFSETTRLGPLVSAIQRDRVRGYITRGIDEGATLLTGGPQPPEGRPTGYFVRPTVFSEVTSGMAIAQEEIFGPVLSIMAYDTDDHAVAMANDSVYGLSGGVWSADIDRAIGVARRIATGHVAINGSAFDQLAPFGGRKRSGIGRENGRFGIAEYLEPKTLQL
ncbi:MAG TPA: aldehyde dehydrogenase family protein [Acidimicrobiales bacterium]|nr:aldehyde dehydrogenase family protein [Acidimicrobiales bacterium]